MKYLCARSLRRQSDSVVENTICISFPLVSGSTMNGKPKSRLDERVLTTSATWVVVLMAWFFCPVESRAQTSCDALPHSCQHCLQRTQQRRKPVAMPRLIQFHRWHADSVTATPSSVGNAAVHVTAFETQPQRSSSTKPYLKPNRLLLITSVDTRDRVREQTQFANSLATELRRVSDFDVVVGKEQVCDHDCPISSGQFDERQLVALGKQYRVDSILFIRVDSFDAYQPMNMQTSYVMVNIPESIATASGSLSCDLANLKTAADFQDSLGPLRDPAVHGVLRLSPTRMIQYTAKHLAGRLAKMW